MAIDCRNLTCRYGDGAGKTTVVRVLASLTTVRHGGLHTFGIDARIRTADIRSNIGYVPQQLPIVPAMTDQQNAPWLARWYALISSRWPSRRCSVSARRQRSRDAWPPRLAESGRPPTP